METLNSMISVISTKTEECENVRGGQKLLADTADTPIVGITDSAHVCQKLLAESTDTVDLAE